IGSRFPNRIETEQIQRLHGSIGQGRDAQGTPFGGVAAFRKVDPSQRLWLIAASAEFAESGCFQLRSVPAVAVHSGGGGTLIGGPSPNGRRSATERVGEQINQCVNFTPSALPNRLHDTRLEPTNVVPDLPPRDGVPAGHQARSRTSKRCRRRHVCFAP